MRFYTICLVLLCSFGCQNAVDPDGFEILNQSIQHHDPNGVWNQLTLKLHIQEPRTGNPHRYSKVTIDNKNNYFELQRNRENRISRHVVDKDGNNFVYLDGKVDFDSTLIEKYYLQPERCTRYKNSYTFMYGLPMTLNTNTIDTILGTAFAEYNQSACYQIDLRLKEPMFSSHWKVYISTEDFTFKGMEFIDDENPSEGEKLHFSEIFESQGVRIPRMRHWFDLKGAYLGSDIIVKETGEE